jgi:TonB family protein
LFGYYWSQGTFYRRIDVRHKLVVQADWFAVHDPSSAVFDMTGFALQKTDFDPPYVADFQIYKGHWKSAMEHNLNDARVLQHAFHALQIVDLDVPFTCAAHLRVLLPTYPQYPVQLAVMFVEIASLESQHAVTTPGIDNFPALTALARSSDSAVIGLTGQALYGVGRMSGKTEAYVPRAEALLNRAHELDPANARWIDALHSEPPLDVASARRTLNIVRQEDLWPGGRVPPLAGAEDAVVVDSAVQVAMRITPSAAFVQNALSSQDGPGNVKLLALIGEDGKVEALQFASGSVRHFPSALVMVKAWLYSPRLSNGKAVRVLTLVDLNFTAFKPSDLRGVAGPVSMNEPPTTRSASPIRISVSAAVMQSNLISRTLPVYPTIAKIKRIGGTVALQANISKTGTVEDLTIVSGPMELRQSALDAVSTWNFRPYLLNGEPVEVQTQINVVFSLDAGAPSQLHNSTVQ